MHHLALHYTLVGLAGDVDLVHGSAQVIEQEGPVAGAQIHLPRLPRLGGALLRALIGQRPTPATLQGERERRTDSGRGEKETVSLFWAGWIYPSIASLYNSEVE